MAPIVCRGHSMGLPACSITRAVSASSYSQAPYTATRMASREIHCRLSCDSASKALIPHYLRGSTHASRRRLQRIHAWWFSTSVWLKSSALIQPCLNAKVRHGFPAIKPPMMPTRSPWPTRGISSATSCRSSVMVAPSCSGERVGRDGVRRDIQLKGSGRTPFSRNGDGRAALGPMLREYLISEAIHALGIPTTRSLAVVTTGEQVVREDLLPGAVLTRVAASHIRVGTFEYFAGSRRSRCSGSATRLRHRTTLRRSAGRLRARAGGARGRCADARPRSLRMDERGLHPRRNEHGQHGHLGRDHRLRAVCIHGSLRHPHGVQLHRPWRAVCVWQSASDRAMESCAIRRNPVTAHRSGD